MRFADLCRVVNIQAMCVLCFVEFSVRVNDRESVQILCWS